MRPRRLAVEAVHDVVVTNQFDFEDGTPLTDAIADYSIAPAFEDFHDSCLNDFDGAVLALKNALAKAGLVLTAVPEPDGARGLIKDWFDRVHAQQYRHASLYWPPGAEALIPIMGAPTLRARRTVLDAGPVNVCYIALKRWPRKDDDKIIDDGEFVDHMINEIWKAAERYDPKNPRRAKFTTFLYNRLFYAVIDWHRAHAKPDDDELPTWKPPQETPIEQLIIDILWRRRSPSPTLTKDLPVEQWAKIYTLEADRITVVNQLLDAAGVSSVHRDACFCKPAYVAAKHNISVDAVYKWRERGRKKIAVIVERLKNGELSDLRRALRKTLATQRWEVGDELRWDPPEPLRPTHAEAAIEPAAPEDLAPNFTDEDEADWTGRRGFNAAED